MVREDVDVVGWFTLVMYRFEKARCERHHWVFSARGNKARGIVNTAGCHVSKPTEGMRSGQLFVVPPTESYKF